MDSKDDNLQLKVYNHLWNYQVVKSSNRYYYLTRLEFGFNCAPCIMPEILDEVLLFLDDAIAVVTDHYIDDVIVNERFLSTEKVVEIIC